MPQDKIQHIYAAHTYYDIRRELEKRPGAPTCTQVSTPDDLRAIMPEVEVLVASMLWDNNLLDIAPRLRLIQSISSGVDQFDLNRLKERGVHLCNARGVNANAVAEHALALMLSLARRLYEARDNQKIRHWSTTGTDPRPRLQELSEKHALIIGMGTIGDRVARLCLALGMKVSGARHSARPLDVAGVEQVAMDDLHAGLKDADYVILTCPLTEQTRHLINAAAFGVMKPDACLVNVARGPVVEEAALIEALDTGRIAGAALDTYDEEPLPSSSPLWSRPNLVMTGHTAGETQFYERNVVDILMKNLAALETGGPLTNQIV
ncbi:D-2-hydroxyacid dehydrogenase [Gluconacetobacter entanii]|uniref:D-2-hydroxyacid dehydrogenase n=1 Tax=Gluconacetobacter entanii TaxID=108528 RepID=A0ABT3K719_9PROT|nr:D-2-hydroxyacid dehydrogenase [Gluconacetobacter entanii]MCW4591211.1 D-2-hydroxyacid dehydrogenase [Gluconacetobacter entanii]MCW4595453.1 D-2-hydroxyacid dehydrogenase [Gluconacetobacter entanii]NPC88535.1 D-2-hydroxyacid dehydrogenase [Gluconacetobacter entanii]